VSVEGKRKANASNRKPLPFILRELHRLFNKALVLEIAEDAPTESEWLILRLLWEEHPLSQRDIAQRAGFWHSAVVGTVDSLEKKGFVRRERSIVDRRRTDIHVTDLGWRKYAEWMPLAEKVVKNSFRGVSAQQIRDLHKTLTQVHANLEDQYGSET
jgi:DNA-binding MarR family transcriptional regulator